MLDLDLRAHGKIIAIIALVLGVLALLITIIVASLSRGIVIEREEIEISPVPTVGEFTLKPEALLLPDIASELWRGIYTPLQKKKKQWGMEELREYLYDPLEIGTENLRKLNQEKINGLLKTYR